MKNETYDNENNNGEINGEEMYELDKLSLDENYK